MKPRRCREKAESPPRQAAVTLNETRSGGSDAAPNSTRPRSYRSRPLPVVAECRPERLMLDLEGNSLAEDRLRQVHRPASISDGPSGWLDILLRADTQGHVRMPRPMQQQGLRSSRPLVSGDAAGQHGRLRARWEPAKGSESSFLGYFGLRRSRNKVSTGVCKPSQDRPEVRDNTEPRQPNSAPRRVVAHGTIGILIVCLLAFSACSGNKPLHRGWIGGWLTPEEAPETESESTEVTP